MSQYITMNIFVIQKVKTLFEKIELIFTLKYTIFT